MIFMTFFINGVRHLGNWDARTLLNVMPTSITNLTDIEGINYYG